MVSIVIALLLFLPMNILSVNAFLEATNWVSPSKVKELNFFENVTGYPRDAIRMELYKTYPSLAKSPKLKEFSFLHPALKISKVFGAVNAQREIGGQETPACDTIVNVMKPLIAFDKLGKWTWIVNDRKLYEQTIYTQECKYEKRACSQIEADLKGGVKSICIQKYTDVKLKAFINGKLKEDQFSLPVSCDCYLTGLSIK